MASYELLRREISHSRWERREGGILDGLEAFEELERRAGVIDWRQLAAVPVGATFHGYTRLR